MVKVMRWGDILYPPAGTPDAIWGPWVRKKIAEARIAKKQKIIDDLYKMLSQISWKWKGECDRLKAAKRRYYKAWRKEKIKYDILMVCARCRAFDCARKNQFRGGKESCIHKKDRNAKGYRDYPEPLPAGERS